MILKDKLLRADLWLLLLFIAICAAILIRAYADETGYTTFDSVYYLELAENLRRGNGFYMSNEYPIPVIKTSQNQIYFTLWPVGYPVLIALTSAITQLNAFWASKVLNLVLVGIGFLFLRRINNAQAYLLACVYCTYTVLAIYTYTWSEAPFILGCLALVYLLSQLSSDKSTNRTILQLFLIGVFLFLMRYAGIFSFGVLALSAAYYWQKGFRRLSIKLFATALALSLFATLYFCINHYFTGSYSGGDRLVGQETIEDFFQKQLYGILNEFFMIRKHYASGTPDIFFWLTLLFQSVIITWIVWLLKDDKRHTKFDSQQTLFPRLCFIVSGLYFIFLFTLRAFSPFDPLDFRLLSPSVFLIFIALLYYISLIPANHRHKSLITILTVFFSIFSLLLNLPKRYIIEQVLSLLS